MTRIVFGLIFLLVQGVFAQDESHDSTFRTEVAVEAIDALYFQREAKREKSPDKSIQLLKKALHLRTTQDDNWVGDIHVEMAACLFKLKDNTQAFSALRKAEGIYTRTNNVDSRAGVLVIMARFYERKMAAQESARNYLSAYKLYQLSGNSEMMASVGLRLAELNIARDRVAQAKQYVAASIKAYKLLSNKNGEALSYIKLARIYSAKGQYKTAEKLLLTIALPYFRTTGYKAGRIECFDALGELYLAQLRYPEAKWFYLQANTQARELNDVEGTISSLVNLSRVKIKIGDYKLAERDLKEAQTLAMERNNMLLLANVKEAYAILFKKLGNKSQSAFALNNSDVLKDSLNHVYNAEVESVKSVKDVQVLPVKVALNEKKKQSVQTKSTDSNFILGVTGFSLVILLAILLILSKIK